MLTTLKYIAIIVLVVLLLRFTLRLLLGYLVKRLARRMGGQVPFGAPRPEGEVRVERGPGPDKRVQRDVGEYVDYEEVKGKE